MTKEPANPEPPLPGFLRVQPDGVQLSVKLQPRASRNEIGEPIGDELKIRVTAPPVDSAANQALLLLLAEALGCPKGAVQLIRGNTSRHKQILIQGLTPGVILGRLAGRP